MTRSFRTAVRQFLLIASFLAVPAGSALAHGPMGPPGGLPPLAMVLLDDMLHAKLGLAAGQEALWLVLDAEDATLDTQMQTSRDALRALVTTELAKETPDLALIESARTTSRAAVAAAMAKVDSAAANLYANLDAQQKALVVATATALREQRSTPGAPPPRP